MRFGFFTCSILALATFALGCDEPVPPTPQAAFLVNFQQLAGTCMHKSHQGMMGVVSATERKTVDVNGVSGASVSCSVKGGTLGPFAVDATLSVEGDAFLTVGIDSIDSKATDAAPAKGLVSFGSPTTALNSYGSNQPCDFYIEPAGPSGVGEGVKPGAAWLTFKCPSMVSGTNTCALNESYVLMENCAQ